MKTTNILWTLVISLLTIAFSSCTNDIIIPDKPVNKPTTSIEITSPVAAPDAVVWSGYQTFGNSLTGTRAAVTNKYKDAYILPHTIEEDEEDIRYVVENIFSQKLEGYRVTRPITFENYFVQNVYKGENNKYPYLDYKGDELGTYMEKDAYHYMGDLETISSNNGGGYGAWAKALYESPWIELENITNSYEAINGFKSGESTQGLELQENGKPNTVFTNTMLMEGMPTELTGDNVWRQFRWKNINLNGDFFVPNYRIVKYKGYYYIGFDFEYVSHQLQYNQNPNQAYVIERDWIFNDWIIRIYPASETEVDNDTDIDWGNPKDPDDDDNDDDDGDDDGDDEEEEEEEDVNEVEINLALNDIHMLGNTAIQKYDIADLVSKLSIHVRYPYDVEVIIPVPEKIYCNQDDLYILKDHYYQENGTPNFEYGSDDYDNSFEATGYQGEEHFLTYKVGNKAVALIITYVPAKDDKLTNPEGASIYKANGEPENYGGGYISVKTSGINEDVINYCRENFGDGINFEVYNYYNNGTRYTTGNYPEITYEELQYSFLSRSMVNFDWTNPTISTKEYPMYYINAFNQLGGQPNKGDCYVWILGDNHAKAHDCSLLLNNEAQLGTGTQITHINWHTENVERNHFRDPKQGLHYNGSPLNWIYTNIKHEKATNSNDMLEVPWPFAKPSDGNNIPQNAPYQFFRNYTNQNTPANDYFNFQNNK